MPPSLTIDPATKAVVAVDYAGQPCDYDSLRSLCKSRGIKLIADACHSFGAAYQDGPVGTLADITAFSFHPVKIITTGEGGMALTNNLELYQCMARLRSHGITRDPQHMTFGPLGPWYYEQLELGYNYRMTELQGAVGLAQLENLDTVVLAVSHINSSLGLPDAVNEIELTGACTGLTP